MNQPGLEEGRSQGWGCRPGESRDLREGVALGLLHSEEDPSPSTHSSMQLLPQSFTLIALTPMEVLKERARRGASPITSRAMPPSPPPEIKTLLPIKAPLGKIIR